MLHVRISHELTIFLSFTGHLSSPESIHINGSVNSSTIQWKPPYSSLNNDTISVDAHITQYTVYITDNYTGGVVKVNVTETRFTFNIQDDDLCPMYQVSAWNASGEGKLSEPVQELTSGENLQLPSPITFLLVFINTLF